MVLEEREETRPFSVLCFLVLPETISPIVINGIDTNQKIHYNFGNKIDQILAVKNGNKRAHFYHQKVSKKNKKKVKKGLTN